MLAQALYSADLIGQEEAQGAVDAYAEVSLDVRVPSVAARRCW